MKNEKPKIIELVESQTHKSYNGRKTGGKYKIIDHSL
jgi:hypothetical protein